MNKKKNIYKAAIGVVIIEIIMKLIAFLKQSIVAYYFGATQSTDIYFVANDFMVSVSETMISAAKVAIMGVYASVLVKEGKEQGNKLMSKFLLFFLPIICIIVGLLIVASPILSNVLAPSFTTLQSQELQKYIILLSGIIIFTITIMIYESVLNTHEVFVVSKIRSLIYSICVIVACIFASTKGVKVLIAAQYSSFLIYLIIQYISARKYYKFSFSNPLKNPYLKKVLKIMFPIMLGNSIIRINYLIDKAVASGIGEGAISALAYCQTLDQLVVAVIISSISSVMFAHFANLVAKNEENKITETLNNALASLCLILMPTTILVLIEAPNIVAIVYGRGNFNQNMVLLAATALQGYAIRYFFVGIRDTIIQALYAYKEVKKPMLVSLVSTIVNVVVSVFFVKKIGILSIALGTSISAIVGTVLNVIVFKKVNKNYEFSVLKNIIIKSIPAVGISIIMSLIITNIFNFPKFLELVIVSIIVFGIYFLFMYLFKVKEVITIMNIIKKYLIKTHNKKTI